MADSNDAVFFPENEKKFWQELERTLSAEHETAGDLDNVLRTWLTLASGFRDRFPDCEEEVAGCAQRLLATRLFSDNKEYVRTQIIYSLVQEDDFAPLHVIVCFLLLDGRSDESTFPRMIDASCFPRLLELIGGCRKTDPQLHRLLLQLMYEMSRMERLRIEDLLQVDDAFVAGLFDIIEEVSDDVDDPYHYPTIRVMLVLNEQYMLASTESAADLASPTVPLTNRVIKCLSVKGSSFRTFGENIILLLNRETETSLQLLILKLLYLLFTTKATYEYFYTNDLKVLLDVIVRNLMDLPDDKASLRHTYLRVFYPLLAHTQLSRPPHYKRDEILRVLAILRGTGNAHFDPTDDTTLRLVDRVSRVEWLQDHPKDFGGRISDGISGDRAVARELLGISLHDLETSSTVSVGDVASVMEKPGIRTPSRKAGEGKKDDKSVVDDEMATVAKAYKKTPPEVPMPRRRRGAAAFAQSAALQVDGPSAHKIPPKAPPPRRLGRIRVVAASQSLSGGEDTEA